MFRNLTTGATLAEHNDVGALFVKYATEGCGIRWGDVIEMVHHCIFRDAPGFSRGVYDSIYPVSDLYRAFYLNQDGEKRLTLIRM